MQIRDLSNVNCLKKWKLAGLLLVSCGLCGIASAVAAHLFETSEIAKALPSILGIGFALLGSFALAIGYTRTWEIEGEVTRIYEVPPSASVFNAVEALEEGTVALPRFWVDIDDSLQLLCNRPTLAAEVPVGTRVCIEVRSFCRPDSGAEFFTYRRA